MVNLRNPGNLGRSAPFCQNHSFPPRYWQNALKRTWRHGRHKRRASKCEGHGRTPWPKMERPRGRPVAKLGKGSWRGFRFSPSGNPVPRYKLNALWDFLSTLAGIQELHLRIDNAFMRAFWPKTGGFAISAADSPKSNVYGGSGVLEMFYGETLLQTRLEGANHHRDWGVGNLGLFCLGRNISLAD